uniref:Zinc finger CCCH-type containing 18 n=1 Tax=Varanus komodoensis TaxID=61221 RepID=A0A8D2LED5_VARKO
MDVSESPEQNPHSPGEKEEEEEDNQQLSDDEILKESGSEQDGEEARGTHLGEEEEDPARALSHEEEEEEEEEENRSDEEDRLSEAKSQDSDNNEQSRELKNSLCVEEEEDRVNDLGDEASSVTRELDEHELDYDEEVPEEPSAGAADDEADKAGGEEEEEEEEEKGDEPPEEEKKPCPKSNDEKDGQEPPKEKKKEEDGEIDDGEIDDDDLEEGEVKDPSDRKVRPRLTCRFFVKGLCTWGMNCRFIHPGVNDKGNYSLISKPDPFPPNGAPPIGPGPHPLMPANPWGGPVVDEILPPPPPDPPVESAWERGLRHAKEVLKKATMRKEQEPDFEEKRFTMTIGEDEREFDKENEFFRDWNYRITREVRDSRTDPYADPYYDYEIERFWRGGQYENFRVQYTDPDPYRNYRLSKERERERERENRQRERERERERERKRERQQRERERERERERDKERQKRKEEWERERERIKRDERDRQHRDRDRDKEKEREKEKEKPKPRSPQPPSRQPEPPKKEKEVTTATPSQSKRADEWKDPWRRSKSPKKKHGMSASPSRARRRRKTSASSASGSGSSRYRPRRIILGAQEVPRDFHVVRAGPHPALGTFRALQARGRLGDHGHPPGALSTGLLGLTLLCAPLSLSPPPRPFRSLSVSSVSSVSSASSSSSSMHSADSEDMYADLASPVSSASSRSPTPAQQQQKKERGGWLRTALPSFAQPPPPPAARSLLLPPLLPAPLLIDLQCSYTAPRRTLQSADKGGSRKRYEPSDKDRQGSPPAKRINLSPDRGPRERKPGTRLSSPKQERQRGPNPKPSPAQADKKRPLSPQSKSSSKVTSIPGKGAEPAPTATPTKSGKSSTLSRREELLKQLKAVEDAIARKRAKIPGKV